MTNDSKDPCTGKINIGTTTVMAMKPEHCCLFTQEKEADLTRQSYHTCQHAWRHVFLSSLQDAALPKYFADKVDTLLCIVPHYKMDNFDIGS